jgi:Fe-S cluster assembly iron-binding protein IscA
MLAISPKASEAITAALERAGGAPDLQALHVEVAEAPRADDRVVEADGAHVFLAPEAAAALEDKVLDAKQDERGVRFAVSHQPPGDAGA